MAKAENMKQEFARFGRVFSVLFNRALMYEIDHPYVKQSLDELFSTVEKLLKSISPLVFAMNRDQFFVEEEPLDPRINPSKMLNHFKKAGIESVSFEEGIGREELTLFMEVLLSLNQYPTAEAMKQALSEKRIDHLRINHVIFRKMTADEEVVQRDSKGTNSEREKEADSDSGSKKIFMDSMIQSVLEEEFQKALPAESLFKKETGPSADKDRKDGGQSETAHRRPGSDVLHKLQRIGEKVDQRLSGEGFTDLSELARAVFEMKRKLIDGLESQKDLMIPSSMEKEIFDKADEISDNVLLRLVKEEYKTGKISTGRLAQVLRRLVPEPEELKRLLPKIKTALLEEGMPLQQYLDLIKELGRELQSDELVKVLMESSERVGLDGKDLLEEVKRNPAQAAELIFLAAEIRKGTGDAGLLTDLLVDYVERLGSKLAADATKEKGMEHFRQVMNGLESTIISRLKEMDLEDNVLERLHQQIDTRLEEIYKKATKESNSSRSGSRRAEAKEIDENDIGQIYQAIAREEGREARPEERKKPRPRPLSSQGIMIFLEKEIARAKRYGSPFSALCLSVVRAKPVGKKETGKINQELLTNAILAELPGMLRDADLVGKLPENRLMALLPMTLQKDARSALRRVLKSFHTKPIELKGIPVSIRVAGVATAFNAEETPDVATFLKLVSDEVTEMVHRVRNIHELL